MLSCQARILEWGYHFLLQGIFLTQGLNPDLPHCRRILYHLSYCGHKIQAANVSEAECDMDCKGERGSVCGGANRLSVYRLQLAQESARRCT